MDKNSLCEYEKDGGVGEQKGEIPQTKQTLSKNQWEEFLKSTQCWALPWCIHDAPIICFITGTSWDQNNFRITKVCTWSDYTSPELSFWFHMYEGRCGNTSSKSQKCPFGKRTICRSEWWGTGAGHCRVWSVRSSLPALFLHICKGDTPFSVK